MLIFQKTFKGMLEVLKPLEMEQKNWIFVKSRDKFQISLLCIKIFLA